MSDHKVALVPIETWCYNSPELLASGRTVDLGLLCEALLYYDRILLHVTTQAQFAALLKWTIETGHFDEFLELVREGTVVMYDYSFYSGPVNAEGVFSVVNIQDPIQAAYGTFPRRFLYHAEIDAIIPNVRRRKRLYDAFKDRVYEVKADDCGLAVSDARLDIADVRRSSLIVQAFVDELYRYRKLGRPPEVSAITGSVYGGAATTTTWNVSFQKLNELAGASLSFRVETPLSGAVSCNRLLWSAAQMKCDLYLASPMARLVGDKLFEASRTPARSNQIIEELKRSVEFPDVRAFVNQGVLTLGEVLTLRKQTLRFRQWLQSASDRDHDAIVAYHNEVAKESGIASIGRKSLNLFGVVGGSAIGGGVGQAVGGVEGAAIGAGVGAGVTFLADLGSKLGAGWRPSVFGEWLSERISELTRTR